MNPSPFILAWIIARRSQSFSPRGGYRSVRRMMTHKLEYGSDFLSGMIVGQNKTEFSDAPNPFKGTTFPVTLVVGHEMIKKALLLGAINPKIGGILLSGGHGTCKSVLARALYRLLPPEIERIKNNPYNAGLSGMDELEHLLNCPSHFNKSEQKIETEFIPTPFVQIPLNVMEDSLVGTIDLEQSMNRGEAVFSPGLLARAHRGVLYIDDINLLDDSVVTILFNVVSEGYVHVEREGISIKYACQPIVIATFNPAEGEVRKHLVDRFAIQLSTDETQLTTEERVTVVRNVLNFSGERVDRLLNGISYPAEEELRQSDIEEKTLQQAIMRGRRQLENVVISHDQMLYLSEEATRAGCEGQRAEIFGTQIAKANAALYNRTKVNVDDLKLAVMLAIVPRSKFILQGSPDDEPDVEQQTCEQERQPGASPPSNMTPEESVDNEEDDSSSVEVEEQDEMNDKAKDDTIEMELPTEFLFGVNSVPIDPNLINFAKSKTKKGKGGKSSILYNLQRGRFVKAIFPKDSNIKSCQLAIAATIRAAAPYQKIRRQHRQKTISASSSSIQKHRPTRMVEIEKSDFRIKKLSKKAGTLVIFVVDASGSMALNRMDLAKGSAITLLSEAYKSRDKICLIAFHGTKAEVLVPITKSIALTKRRLESLPCGGGSPLSHALSTAIRLGLNSIKVKKDVGRVVIVLITDGRANIPLCVSFGNNYEPSLDTRSILPPSKKFLKDEVLMCAKKIGAMNDFDMLVIDTEDKFVGTGVAKDLAKAARANYYHIEAGNLGRVTSLTKETVESFRK